MMTATGGGATAMQLKHILGVIGALIPIAYCGGLLYYFVDSMGSVDDAQTNGLGPTLLGLSVVGLLFFIPLSVKLVRLFTAPSSTEGADRERTSKRSDKPEAEFDPDAVLARYMAKRSTDEAGDQIQPSASAPRATFGRKVAHPAVGSDTPRPKI